MTVERSFLVASRQGPGSRLGGLRLAGRISGGTGVRPRQARTYASYALMLVTRGQGRYRDARLDVELRAGDAVLVFPGKPHWYGVIGAGTWDELFLVLTGPLFALAEESGLLQRSTPVVRVGTDPAWARRIDGFRTRPAPTTAHGHAAEAVEVLGLLADLLAPRDGDAAAPRREDWHQLSRRLLSADLTAHVDLADVAAACGMRYETWRRRFRAEVGESPARYRLRARTEAALSMLRLTSLTVREIARSAGFTDEQHLNSHLRQSLGMTARQYRLSRPS